MQVVDVMGHLVFGRDTAPLEIRIDKGPDFISKALDY